MTDRISEALAAVPRRDFLPDAMRRLADEDRALDIGYGSTCSQPWTVAYMLRLLDPQPGDRVLDVGSGSGWTTALLAHLVGPTGSVTGVEIVPALVSRSQADLGSRWPWARVELSHPNVLGLPNAGGFDRILVSADGGRVPEELVAQLRPGGRLVTPASCEMWVVDKDLDGNVHRRTTGDRFRFVPLRSGTPPSGQFS